MMDHKEFVDQLRESVPVGTIFDNPGGGTSKILSYTKNKDSYKRGNSTIYVPTQGLYEAYMQFKGQRITTSDLKTHSPSIFDSAANGHSCNCTFLFLALQRMGIAGDIQGKGVRGAPFSVEIQNK